MDDFINKTEAMKIGTRSQLE